VRLIAANLEVRVPENVGVVHVSTTMELADALEGAVSAADIVIMAAAVADYRPETVAESKIKKEDQGDILTLTLVKNPDILRAVSASKRDDQVIVGFAAETETDETRLLELGRAKIARKGCDYLVLNSVGWNSGFATDDNAVTVLNAAGDIVSEATGSKSTVADRILDAVAP
jgi:phosphopantothenoylcysteine decarboxylase/phosphopantothenate--cysteine ligase